MVRPRPCWILCRVVPLSDTRHSTKWPAGHNSTHTSPSVPLNACRAELVTSSYTINPSRQHRSDDIDSGRTARTRRKLSEIFVCIDIRLMFRHLKGSMDIGVAMQTFANVSENGFDVAAAGAGRCKRNGV